MDQAEIVERQRLAHTLRLAGLTPAEIAAYDFRNGPLFVDASAASQAIRAYQESHANDDEVAEQLALDMARYDALQRAMWRKALSGDVEAGKFVLEVMKARERRMEAGKGGQSASGNPLDELRRKREQRASRSG